MLVRKTFVCNEACVASLKSVLAQDARMACGRQVGLRVYLGFRV
jgi:hypothetical protein